MTLTLLLLASAALSWAISIGADANLTRYWYEMRQGEVLAQRMKELGL